MITTNYTNYLKKQIVLLTMLISGFVFSQTIFNEDFGTSQSPTSSNDYGRKTSPYMPSGSFTYGTSKANSSTYAINNIDNDHYAVVAPEFIYSGVATDYYFWTLPSPGATGITGAPKPYTEDHTTGDTNGAVMVVNAGSTLNSFYQRNVNLEKGSCYRLSFWVYLVNASSQVGVEIKDVSSNAVLQSYSTAFLSTEAAWTQYTIDFKMPTTCTSSDIKIALKNIYSNNSGNDYFIDDIKLEKLSTCTATAISSCPTGKDTDGDGIADDVDLDSDNDGILDSVEKNTCSTASKMEGTPIYINDFGTGSTTSDTHVLNHTYINGDANDGQYNVRTSGTSGVTYTRTDLTGNKDAGNPTISNGSTTGRYLMINIDSPNNINKAIYRVSAIPTQIGQGYRFRIDMAGLANGLSDIPKLKIAIKDASNTTELASATSTSIGMANDDVWRRLNLEFTATTSTVVLEIINQQATGSNGNDVGIDNIIFTPLYCDTDGDGNPNYLDLDSDSDGCPDAVEGGDSISQSMLDANGRINVAADGITTPVVVDVNGVPVITNTGSTYNIDGQAQGQTVGQSQTNNPAAVAGTVATNQSISSGATPSALTLTGSTGTIQWQSSANNVSFNNISGATSATYSPGALTTTTYYRAVVSSVGGCKVNSNTVIITVIAPLDTDGDGIPDNIDIDDDNDGITDCDENLLGANASVSNVFSFVTAGTAVATSNNEVRLTQDTGYQAGQIWSVGKVDFTKSFVLRFDAYLGTHDDGADGIAAVFHNSPQGVNATGATGLGIGASGIANGIVLELDTFDNGTSLGDISSDHGQIWDSDNQTSTGFLTTAVALPNLENSAWHPVVINWNATTKTISYTVDGTNAGTYTGDLVTNYFAGANKVYFGYTASTGGSTNEQKIRINSFCSDLPLEMDNDNDGIPNQLDTDSDGDGCADAIEGSENVTYSQIHALDLPVSDTNYAYRGQIKVKYDGVTTGSPSQIISTSAAANGVPQLLNNAGNNLNTSTNPSNLSGVIDNTDGTADVGQAIGASQDNTINSCKCYKTPSTDGNTYPTQHGITAFSRAGADNQNWPMVRQSGWTALEASTKGFVINRMPVSTSGGNTGEPVDGSNNAVITSPIAGMMFYDTTNDCLKINVDGTRSGWKCFNKQTCPDEN